MNIECAHGATGFHAACFKGQLNVIQFLLQKGFKGIKKHVGFFNKTALEMLIEVRPASDEHFMPCLLLLIEAGAELTGKYAFKELIFAIQNRISEITLMKEIIFEKWTGRIAQVITDYSMGPFTNTSLENLSQFLGQNFKMNI
jgi:hypothetical protein